MRNYILPILAASFLFFSSCNEDAATDTVDAVKNTTSDAIKKTTDAVKDNATNINEQAKEKINNVAQDLKKSTATVTNPTTMSVDRKVHDFGTISDDAKVTTTFTITNTGKKPLIITQAKGSCGCTVPDYPKTPIAPGSTGNIEVSFDPKGKAGAQNKTVTIIANTEPANTILNIKSIVNKTEAPTVQ